MKTNTATRAAHMFANSPTLRAAFDHTIAFCAEHRITDEAEIGAIMNATVTRMHEELRTFVHEVLGGERPEVREALMLRTYVGIRDAEGLDVPADVRAQAEQYGYRS